MPDPTKPFDTQPPSSDDDAGVSDRRFRELLRRWEMPPPSARLDRRVRESFSQMNAPPWWRRWFLLPLPLPMLAAASLGMVCLGSGYVLARLLLQPQPAPVAQIIEKIVEVPVMREKIVEVPVEKKVFVPVPAKPDQKRGPKDLVRSQPLPPGVSLTEPAPPPTGLPRDFGLADVRLHCEPVLVKINGQTLKTELGGEITGRMLWVSIPGKGTFRLAVVPPADAQFLKLGSVNGRRLNFLFENDSIEIESRRSFLDSPGWFTLWVKQEPEATGSSQAAMVRFGVVAPVPESVEKAPHP
ncbi:MAG: hypothetical protein K1Y36_08565 [Blastocatellia bacterium]|nr:hypothetical protein [Blastocatellia bacterium]